MGDIIHAMAALQFMKRHDPSMHIDWITEEMFAPLLEHNPHIDNILTVNLKALKRNKSALFSEIRKIRHYAANGYDLVIDAQGLMKSAVVARLLGKVAGFDKDSVREKAATWFYETTFTIPYETNVIERNLRLMMSAVGAIAEAEKLEVKEPFLYFTQEEKAKLSLYLKENRKTIVHVLGSSWESKVYPKEKFIEVIGALEGKHLLVWGDEKEKERAAYIAKRTEATVLPKLTLNELKACIASADLVIGADSGPTHMAWALNRPSITLFGPTPSTRNTMHTPINRTLDCGKRVDPRRLDREDHCIRQIPSEKVVSLAKELLA